MIGAIFIEPRLLKDIGAFLTASDFSSKRCAAVYAFALEKFSKGEPFDPVIAMEALNGIYDNAAEFFTECINQTGGTFRNGVYHAQLLQKAANDLRLYNSVIEALNTLEADEIPTELIKIGNDAMKGKLGKRRSMQELVMQFFDGLSDGPEKRLDTGFRHLDALLMGMRPGNLLIAAARPGVGKSAFAMQIAENVAKAGKKVLIYSLEMSGDELTERLVSKEAVVPMERIIQRNFENDDMRQIAESCQRLSTLPIIVNDESNVAPSKVRTEAVETQDVELVIVDYVGLMDSDGGKRAKENRNLELGSISRDLKKIAMELQIPILMLCQLNREIDDETKPELRHLRDSGELEQNANKIIFLWNLDPDSQTVGVCVAKNRQGKKGIVQMVFDSEHMNFAERISDLPMPDYGKKRRRGENYYDD